MIRLLLPLLLSVLAATAAEVQYRVAEARDDKGDLRYRELHKLTRENGKLVQSEVIYASKDGQLLAAMRSDFSASIASPDTLFVTKGLSYSYRIKRLAGNRLEVTYRDVTASRTETLTAPDNAVCGQGFSYAITDKIDDWRRGKSEKVAFLMPGRFDYFDFDLKALGKRGGDQLFRMRIANFFLRLFVTEITMRHDLKTGLLTHYEGPSNVVYDADENGIPVVLTYSDSDGERFASLREAADELLNTDF